MIYDENSVIVLDQLQLDALQRGEVVQVRDILIISRAETSPDPDDCRSSFVNPPPPVPRPWRRQ